MKHAWILLVLGVVLTPAARSAGPGGIKEFTRNGQSSFVVPSGVTRLMVEMYGGGGGGGGGSTIPCDIGAGGGGSGAYTRTVVAVTAGATYSVFVGAAGLGAPFGPDKGSNGGRSRLVAPDGTTVLVSAGGGQGGQPPSGTTGGAGGIGGAKDSNAAISHSGVAGQNGSNACATAPAAGGVGYSIPGFTTAVTFGGGGLGSIDEDPVPDKGGNGQPGYVLLTW
jgi:hypothetical protein